jgi:hypothetical protein
MDAQSLQHAYKFLSKNLLLNTYSIKLLKKHIAIY